MFVWKNLKKTSENNIKNVNTKSLKIKTETHILEKPKRERIECVFWKFKRKFPGFQAYLKFLWWRTRDLRPSLRNLTWLFPPLYFSNRQKFRKYTTKNLIYVVRKCQRQQISHGPSGVDGLLVQNDVTKGSNLEGHFQHNYPGIIFLFRRDCLHGVNAGNLECSGPQVQSKKCNRIACSNDAAITQIPQITEFWTTEIPNFVWINYKSWHRTGNLSSDL